MVNSQQDVCGSTSERQWPGISLSFEDIRIHAPSTVLVSCAIGKARDPNITRTHARVEHPSVH